jgi:hypothetical protein
MDLWTSVQKLESRCQLQLQLQSLFSRWAVGGGRWAVVLLLDIGGRG